ncbi:MAG: M3 family metallopeptidase [Melioribacteraceae bacterium]|nr:M3 family metallopeptidase [Melioribacteraceae bacterium]
MKRSLIFLTFLGLILMSCTEEKNPFFSKFETPFNTPDFTKIKDEHYLPAYKKGIEDQKKEIAEIVTNSEEPTFKNTIEALDESGLLLDNVSAVYNGVKGTDTNPVLQKISKEIAPMLSAHNDDIKLNEKLFARIKSVYDKKDSLNLNREQELLLEEFYSDFVRGGANLDETQKNELRVVNKELSLLTLKFGDNVLEDNNAFQLVIDNKDDLEGLPQSVIDASSEAAKANKLEGKWLFTIDKPSLIPFLMYSSKRDLREKMYKGYINKGDNNNNTDNKKVLSKIAALRVTKANLLGFKTYADFVLDINMAKEPKNVYKLLNDLWKPALVNAKKEVKELQKLINKEGNDFELKAWDWWFYAEKLKKEKYAIDDEVLRPYFQLENVRKGAFDVANKLWGITLTERTDIPVYNPEVKVYEVKEADGKHIGILYTDYFPRASKQSGAWMDAFRKQYTIDGKEFTPIIYNVGNFSKPTADKPSLLSFDEVSTLFHEFGHALHGLLSKCQYRTLSGTSVARDFVELPSQIMENWASEPEVLRMYAKHYKTGEVIPDELIEKLENASHFNQGFITVEYLSAAFLDMDWHTLDKAEELSANEFENNSLNGIGLIPEIAVRYRSPYFKHIFSGGYASGYYSYVWAEVLDADAFAAFKEKGIFDQETAKAFRENVLAKGGTEEAMTLYRNFRGEEPKVDALLKRKGLL